MTSQRILRRSKGNRRGKCSHPRSLNDKTVASLTAFTAFTSGSAGIPRMLGHCDRRYSSAPTPATTSTATTDCLNSQSWSGEHKQHECQSEYHPLRVDKNGLNATGRAFREIDSKVTVAVSEGLGVVAGSGRVNFITMVSTNP
jgi:hypothetical protein